MRDQAIAGPHLRGVIYRNPTDHVPQAQATLVQVTVRLMGNRFMCPSNEGPAPQARATQELVIVAGGESSQARSGDFHHVLRPATDLTLTRRCGSVGGILGVALGLLTAA